MVDQTAGMSEPRSHGAVVTPVVTGLKWKRQEVGRLFWRLLQVPCGKEVRAHMPVVSVASFRGLR